MSWIKSLFSMLFSTLVMMPLLTYLILYLIQDQLIFIRQPLEDSSRQWLRNRYPHSELQITTPDNIKLHGWLVKNTSHPKAPLLIYFGGNAEEVSSWLWKDAEKLSGWAVSLVNYRGYGLSEGQPSETNLFKDALFLYDTFSKREDIDTTKIVAMGRSLGTGVAVYLASQRPLQAVILVSPYDSLRSVAQQVYFFVPVSLLLKHPFDSLKLAPAIKIPMLAVIAPQDEVISPSHSWKLVKAWGGKVSQQLIDNRGHNDIQTGSNYWESISEFLEKYK